MTHKMRRYTIASRDTATKCWFTTADGRQAYVEKSTATGLWYGRLPGVVGTEGHTHHEGAADAVEALLKSRKA